MRVIFHWQSEILTLFKLRYTCNTDDMIAVPGFQRQRVWQAMWQPLERPSTLLMPTMMKGSTGMQWKPMLIFFS